MAGKRKAWNGIISGFSANNLVFLDESGCNIDMTRRYAYAQGGSRAVDSAPLSKPKNTTILSSIQLDGSLHYTTFSGGITVEKFKQYLVNDLLQYLNPDSVLVMKNRNSALRMNRHCQHPLIPSEFLERSSRSNRWPHCSHIVCLTSGFTRIMCPHLGQ